MKRFNIYYFQVLGLWKFYNICIRGMLFALESFIFSLGALALYCTLLLLVMEWTEGYFYSAVDTCFISPLEGVVASTIPAAVPAVTNTSLGSSSSSNKVEFLNKILELDKLSHSSVGPEGDKTLSSEGEQELIPGRLKDLTDDFDNNFMLIMKALSILKNDSTKLEVKRIEKRLYNDLYLLGISSDKINSLINVYKNSTGFSGSTSAAYTNEIEGGKYKTMVIEYVNRVLRIVKEQDIPSKYFDHLTNILLQVSTVEDKMLKKNIDSIKQGLIVELNDNLSTKTKKSYSQKKGSFVIKNKSLSDYKGSSKAAILNAIHELKELSISNLNLNSLDQLNKIRGNVKTLNKLLGELYDKKINTILSKLENVNYNKESMTNVVTIREYLIEYLITNYKYEFIADLSVISSVIESKVDCAEQVKGKVNRMNVLDIDSGFYGKVNQILKTADLNLELKQITIERLILNNDLNYFEEVMQKSININSIVLHDIYSRFNHELNVLLQPYIKNNYRLLKKSVKDRDVNGLVLLFILYVGNNSVINICYSQIMNILSDTWGEYRINKTTLLFQLSVRLLKLGLNINIKKIRRKEELKRYQDLFTIWSSSEIEDVLDNYKNNNLFLSALGDVLLNIILKEHRIFKVDIQTEWGINVKHINTILTLTLQDDYKHKLVLRNTTITQLPMLIKPSDADENGKYFPNVLPEISHIYNSFDNIIKNKYDQLYNTTNQGTLISTIKTLNSVKFMINKRLLSYIMAEWYNENSVIFQGFNRILTINETDSKEDKINKQSHNSKYYNYLSTLNIANLYKDQSFYIPTFADFRGRIYTLSHYLTYQGNDLSRSLLLFGDTKEAINKSGLEYLKVYFANLAGYSKDSWDFKLKWTNKHILTIINLFNNNKEKFNIEYLNHSKEPFQFISILFALESYICARAQNKELIIQNPILFDASCSGIQHLSALTRELDLAIKTNVVGKGLTKELPEDFYSYAASLIQEELDLSSNNELRSIKVNRNLIKKSVMTIPYNISLIGVKEQLKEYFVPHQILNYKGYLLSAEFSKENTPVFLNSKSINEFTVVVYKVLTEKLPSLKALNQYLNSLVTILSKLNQPIFWITPSGLHVRLSTIEFKSIRTKSKLYPNAKPVTISIPTNKLDTQQIKRSFMPNLIHSLDASNIHLLCNKITSIAPPFCNTAVAPLPFTNGDGDGAGHAKSNNIGANIYTIHDCFATSPNEMSLLERYVKEAFIEIYFKDGNYLNKMHNHILEQIKSFAQEIVTDNEHEYIIIKNEKIKIPQIPNSFTSDTLMKVFINGILKSRYFIS